MKRWPMHDDLYTRVIERVDPVEPLHFAQWIQEYRRQTPTELHAKLYADCSDFRRVFNAP
jgi:hypothetical protein